MYSLKTEYQEAQDDWAAKHSKCYCHFPSSCRSCEHPGNPNNLADNEDAWHEDIQTPE